MRYMEHIHLIVLRSVIVFGRIPWGEALSKTSLKMSCSKKSDGCIASCHDWDWNLQDRLLQLEYHTNSHGPLTHTRLGVRLCVRLSAP